jgi:hypothetical protein
MHDEGWSEELPWFSVCHWHPTPVSPDINGFSNECRPTKTETSFVCASWSWVAKVMVRSSSCCNSCATNGSIKPNVDVPVAVLVPGGGGGGGGGGFRPFVDVREGRMNSESIRVRGVEGTERCAHIQDEGDVQNPVFSASVVKTIEPPPKHREGIYTDFEKKSNPRSETRQFGEGLLLPP